MSNTPKTISVFILGTEYQVSCPPQQVAALEEAARYLDSQMQHISDAGQLSERDEITVQAAINISHELLQAAGLPGADLSDPLKRINAKLDAVLKRSQHIKAQVIN